jgi:hypothetical protein
MSIQTKIFQQLKSEEFLIFAISFFILWNLGFHILVYFPLDQSPDIQNYLAMAQMDFDQSPVRRYRIIIPLLAGLIHFMIGWCFDAFHPWSFEGDFSLCFSFLLINTVIMSVAMVIIYKLCKSFQTGFWFCTLAVIAVLSSRWSSELAGLPLVDSLYFLSMALALFGLKTKQNAYIIASIWIGPWAKEAFIFIVPLILIVANTKRLLLIKHLIFSGILVFSFRFIFDYNLGHPLMSSIREDFSSFDSIGISMQRLFSFHGLYDLFSVVGFWLLIPLFAIFRNKALFASLYSGNSVLFNSYLIIVMFQALLSTDLSRMFYLAIPVMAVWIAISLNVLMNTVYDQTGVK